MELDPMDKISELPDALLLEILSFVPTKDVVATMVLSKRWQFLWMFVPKLEYDQDMFQDGEDHDKRFSRFVYNSLLLHEAPVLQSLYFKLSQNTGSIDIGVCVRTAIKRGVRQLRIVIDSCSNHKTMDSMVVLPRSVYTSCSMLVTLVLDNLVLTDYSSSSSFSFPSLNTLYLTAIKYPNDEFLPKLLYSCPVLENMFVVRSHDDNVELFVIRVASLKVLGLYKEALYGSSDMIEGAGYLIDAPSLELLELNEVTDEFYGIENNMPKIEAAKVYVMSHGHTEQIFSSLTSLKQLGLCLTTSKNAYPEGIIFSRLVRLHLCTCDPEWLNLLMRLLKDSPKLRILRLEQDHFEETTNPRPCWNEPSHVPECLSSSLESFEWLQYQGREEEIEVARFILRNSSRLKIATFCPMSEDPEEKLEMLLQLSTSPRKSSTCQVDFGHRVFTKRCIFCEHRLVQRLPTFVKCTTEGD